MKKTIHALAAIFPELSATAFEQLKASIEENGQRDEIVLLGDEIIDGRNRYKACLELGIAPTFRNYDPAKDGASPVKFVADKNLNRRQLSPGQRAAVAKRINDALEEEAKNAPKFEEPSAPADEDKTGATVEEPATDPRNDATPEATPEPKGDERPFRKREKEAADAAGASPRALRDFKFVERYSPKDAKLVTDGEITLNEGVKRAKAAKDKVSKFRNESADHIASNHDDAFAEKVREGEVLMTDGDLRAFNRLDLKGQRRIKDLVEKGMTVAKATKMKDASFESSDRIEALLEYFGTLDKDGLDEAGWATVKVGSFVIAIGKQTKTDAEEA